MARARAQTSDWLRLLGRRKGFRLLGVIRHDGIRLSRFPIGEPDGSIEQDRLKRLAAAFKSGGLEAPIVPDVRAWIWAKMVSSLTWNPIACLTGATLEELTARREIVSIVRRDNDGGGQSGAATRRWADADFD